MCILKMVAIFGYNHFFMLTKEDVENIFYEFEDEEFNITIIPLTDFDGYYVVISKHPMDSVLVRERITNILKRHKKNYNFTYTTKNKKFFITMNLYNME